MTGQCHRRQSRAIRFLLTAVVLATCARVWLGPEPVIDSAQAQIPDAGAQRKELVEELRRTNQMLGDITQLLKTHTFKVRVEAPDKPGTAPPPKPATGNP